MARTRGYAEGTEVSVEKSQAEIRSLITRYGATRFGYLEANNNMAQIVFQVRDRRVIFRLPFPDRNDKRFWRSPGGRVSYTPEQRFKAWEGACRQAWRALALVIKAKLEAVQSGIVTFEDEFLAYTLKPDGETIGDWAKREMPGILDGRPLPPLLMGPSEALPPSTP
jgi:hypothetical protein